MAVLEAFAASEMGEGCALWSPAELARHAAAIAAPQALGALHSPHDLRVDSRAAVPRVAAFLAERHGVEFRWRTAALEVAPPRILTSRGPIAADVAVVCPGDDLASLFPEVMTARGVGRCVLSMLRLAAPDWRLPAPLMSDLSLVRYAGWAELPPAAALRTRLQAELPDALAHGVHLIAVAGSDGSLVVGDSHHYGHAVTPFMDARTEALILAEFAAATGRPAPPVVERWSGTYAHVPDLAMFAETVAPAARLVVVTGGTGASTAFAIAEEVVGELFAVEDWT
jgi:FAD dependent oxidoreductase TIGR03364